HLGIHLGVLELSYRSRSTEHSVATLLEAALFEAFVNHAPAIGPHKARPHLASHPAATPFICGENGGPETEVSAVRHADGVFFCIEHLERLDRAEELVLHDRYVQTIDFEKRRGIVGTARTFVVLDKSTAHQHLGVRHSFGDYLVDALGARSIN